jgi:hypothetical protein
VRPRGAANISINSIGRSRNAARRIPCFNRSARADFERRAPGDAASGNTTRRLPTRNELGVHCGDLHTREARILPPFNAGSQSALPGHRADPGFWPGQVQAMSTDVNSPTTNPCPM